MKQGDRFQSKYSSCFIIELIGSKLQIINNAKGQDYMPIGATIDADSFYIHNYHFLGNFSKSDNIITLYDILEGR